MQVFNLTLSQMLMMFSLMIIGFLLRKLSILPVDADRVMSRLETYVFSPALVFSTQLVNCTVDNFKKFSVYMIYSLAIGIIAVLISYPLARLFVNKKREGEALLNIYKYAITFGNFGFLGNFLVLGVWGSEMLFKYTMFTFPLSVLCYSWGLAMLIPAKARGFAGRLKSLLNPPLIALVLGIISGLLGLKKYLPEFFLTMTENAGDCMGPVAMILAGFVVGGFEIKSILFDKKVYAVTFLRLIAIPALLVLILKALGTPEELTLLAFIAYACPLGLNTVVYPAAFGLDTKPGASMALVSHTLCVITIPLMYLILM